MAKTAYDKMMDDLLEQIYLSGYANTIMPRVSGKNLRFTMTNQNGQSIDIPVGDVRFDFVRSDDMKTDPKSSPVKLSAYDLLGLASSASPAEIVSAFRRLAKQWHPDVNKTDGASEMFADIQQAYKLLSDPKMRKKYDAIRKLEEGNQPQPQSSWARTGYPSASINISGAWSACSYSNPLTAYPTHAPRRQTGNSAPNPYYVSNFDLLMSAMTKSRGMTYGGVRILHMTRGYDAGEVEIDGIFRCTPGDELSFGGVAIGTVRSSRISRGRAMTTEISFDLF